MIEKYIVLLELPNFLYRKIVYITCTTIYFLDDNSSQIIGLIMFIRNKLNLKNLIYKLTNLYLLSTVQFGTLHSGF